MNKGSFRREVGKAGAAGGEERADSKKRHKTISPEIKLLADIIQKDLDWALKPFNSLTYTERNSKMCETLFEQTTGPQR